MIGDTLSHLPSPADKRIAVHVTAAAERAIRRGHPWLFENAINQQSHQGDPGDLAVLFGSERRFIAIGLYDPHSVIRVRILHQGRPLPIDDQWYREKIEAAAQVRSTLHRSQTSGYRLVHGENDGLPGMVIDRYDQTHVIKLYTAAWVPNLRPVLNALQELLAPDRIVLRLSRGLLRQTELLHGLGDGSVVAGPELPGPIAFQENGLTFEADVQHGQKTGFFFDQRDNRARVQALAARKSVLNVFAYSGGFSLYAARGGACKVASVDMSRRALAAAERNFRLNAAMPAVSAATHSLIQGDAFRALEDLIGGGEQFDMVILDPPSFARKKEQLKTARHAYRRLINLGLKLLRREGTLVAASCSSQVPAASFFQLVHDEAVTAGRTLHEIERTYHPIDHPVTFKEGAYLKCLFAIAG